MAEDVTVEGVTKRFDGERALDATSLDVAAGSVMALLGPSGCGKTTLLRVVAGLERPDAGEVSIGGRAVTGPATFVAPERRRVGLVFQDWALFPHLTVGENVAYGLPRADRRDGRRVTEVLSLVGLAGFEDRRPSTLSGGQQQRVAVARALAPRPSVLLMDEPFSNLDAALRSQVRSDLRRLLARLGVTTIFVTHDQEEAFVVGTEVAVMRDGRVVQQGPPTVVYHAPASPWIARFVGEANILDAVADGDVASTPLGPVPLRSRASGPVSLLVRPEELTMRGGGPATVTDVEFRGRDCTYAVQIGGAELLVRRSGPPGHAVGDRVTVEYVAGGAAAWPPAPDGPPNEMY